ncbi:sulfite exporter TauE/SafE family protein [Polynucleobacter sp. AP-Kolm-20A-A1]|uniref:sulfite exporter TauE/SafE family protein n=1 Tax=Polynucleobacter sp. AP-Kolm-20A-A1 TaxID=2081041 RepID=UPI001BFDFB99|nr:sulfite exporter TauE/SafE family protein [Polynucleobacter sp. AP-Kolm-20A-A1]QWE20123.1 sulfite exporter TauE/SafE family protein [Polynucleobacter sp. AP-Kolm-20A-A1]
MLLSDILMLMLCGAISGYLAGLLGIGGGMILVPFMILVFNHLGFSQEVIVHMAIATGMATILFTTSSAIWAHHKHGSIDWKLVAALSPGMIFGGLIGGSELFEVLKTSWLSLFFAVFIVYTSIQMLLNKKPKAGRELPGTLGLFSFGAFAGALASLVGAGGAFITVPFMLWCNVKPHTAMASSSGLGFPIAAAATIGYMYGSWGNPNLPAGSLGFVYLPAVACIVVVSIFTAPLGAKMARKLDIAQLKRVFGILLFFLAAFMFNESRKAFGF